MAITAYWGLSEKEASACSLAEDALRGETLGQGITCMTQNCNNFFHASSISIGKQWLPWSSEEFTKADPKSPSTEWHCGQSIYWSYHDILFWIHHAITQVSFSVVSWISFKRLPGSGGEWHLVCFKRPSKCLLLKCHCHFNFFLHD